MNAIIRLVPGVLGVLAAYVALRVLAWLLGLQSIAGEILLMLVVYLVVRWLAERALRHYQEAETPPI